MYYKNRIYKVIGCILLCMIYAGFVLRFNVGIPCIFYKITGLKCSGCGITRMLLSIWKLDFRSAYEANQMIFILQPVLYYFIVKNVLAYIRGQQMTYRRWENVLLYILIVLMLGFFVIRNIPPEICSRIIDCIRAGALQNNVIHASVFRTDDLETVLLHSLLFCGIGKCS